MKPINIQKLLSILLLAGMALTLVAPAGVSARPAGTLTPLRPFVARAVYHDTSPALRSMPAAPQPPGYAMPEERPLLALPSAKAGLAPTGQPDPLRQANAGPNAMPATIMNFEGIGNLFGGAPPDTQGDIGYDPASGKKYYVQWINVHFSVWDVTAGTSGGEILVLGPVTGNTIFQGFGGYCETTNDGDPISLFDPLAKRWLMSQFALPNYPSGPFFQCIAVSKTADPTGEWYRYAYEWKGGDGAPVMNDYPKFGVWPDGYYMTTNQFYGTSPNCQGSWCGAGVAVFERSQMLQGLEANMVSFDLASANVNFGGMLPSDLDGSLAPPEGAPNLFMEVDDSPDKMRIWQFHADWTNPANSTFGSNGQPNFILDVASFDPLNGSIPQPDTSNELDTLADRLMHRLAYRNFGSYEALVVNHTVDAGSGTAGVRWYEVRNPANPVIYQQGTYAPDNSHRWMGSIAQDHNGNMALGYSISSPSLYPSIRYTGRLASDPLGQMAQGEANLLAGAASQTGYTRWGDYSMMAVDPLDDCTFWYTTEYSGGGSNWHTRIGSFKFPSCTSESTGTLEGMATRADTGAPLANAQVSASQGVTHTTTLSGSDGKYSLKLPPGDYTVKAEFYGYQPNTASGVQVLAGQTTTQNFSMQSASFYRLSGTVRDANTGWPLYASLQIGGYPYGLVHTNPQTGAYQVTLASGVAYSLTAQAWVGGYLPGVVDIGQLNADHTQDVALDFDPAACSAPGYRLEIGGCTPPASGGLVVGVVTDANTGTALTGAPVSNDNGGSFSAAATGDPAVGDAFYTLFSPPGLHIFTATHNLYASQVAALNVPNLDVLQHNFPLVAGRFELNSNGEGVRVAAGQVTRVVTLTNIGGAAATFDLQEINAAYRPPVSGPLAPAGRAMGFKHMDDHDARYAFAITFPTAPAWPGGAELSRWNSGLVAAWGVGSTLDGKLWLGEAPVSGADRSYPFQASGSPAGTPVDAPWAVSWGADMAYNPLTRRLWQLNVGGDNCLYALDPQAARFTGEKICARFAKPPRGLAYDPQTGTYYAGSWTDRTIYHFDAAGRTLDSVNVPLNVAGLAFNPSTGHLFVANNAAAPAADIYVLDTADHYALLGSFDIAALGDYEQAGLDLDCQGSLWAVNQVSGEVIEAASGESGTCAWMDVPWLSAAPVSATVPTGQDQPVQLTFDPAGLAPGLYQAQVFFNDDTPYLKHTLPVTLQVLASTADLTPPASAEAGDPGQAVAYTFNLYNAGSLADNFTLSASASDWPVTLPVTQVSLAGFEARPLQAVIHIAANALAGEQRVVTLTARPQSAPGSPGQATLTTSANAVYGVTVSTPAADQAGNPGQAVAYTLQITNTGNTTDTFDLSSVTSNPAWLVSLPANSGALAPGAAAAVTGYVHVPGNALPGATNLVTVTASSRALPAIQAAQPLTTRANAYRAVAWIPASAGQTGDGGTVLVYVLQVSNPGNLPDVYDLAVTANSLGWPVQLSTSDIALEPFQSLPVTVEVSVPLTAVVEAQNVTTLAARSQADPDLAAQVVLTSAVTPRYNLDVAPNKAALSGAPGSYVFYTLHVTNTGNISDTYDLSYPDPAGTWGLVVSADQLSLPGGQAGSVTVRFTVPADAQPGASVFALITFTSRGAPELSRPVELTTSAAKGLYRLYLPVAARQE